MTPAASTGPRLSVSSSHGWTRAGRVSGGFVGRASSGGRLRASAMTMTLRGFGPIVDDAPGIGSSSRDDSVGVEECSDRRDLLGLKQHRRVTDTGKLDEARFGA